MPYPINRKMSKHRKPTEDEIKTHRQYEESGKAQFGNLHERMKWLKARNQELHEHFYNNEISPELKTILSRLTEAICDLETEVSWTKPANPPYGTHLVVADFGRK